MGRLRVVIVESNNNIVKRLFKHKIYSMDNLRKRPLNKSFISVYPSHVFEIAKKIVNRVMKGEKIVIATDDMFLVLAIDRVARETNLEVEYVNYNTCIMTASVREAISDMIDVYIKLRFRLNVLNYGVDKVLIADT